MKYKSTLNAKYVETKKCGGTEVYLNESLTLGTRWRSVLGSHCGDPTETG
jgi:hypothetical protein